MLLRDHRDLESARAFPARATGHRACRRAIREHAPAAVHTVTGLHRAPGHATAQPIERSHVPVKDRRRPMRGRQALETGQRLAEGVALARASRRGDVTVGAGEPAREEGPHQRARRVVATAQRLAGEPRRASSAGPCQVSDAAGRPPTRQHPSTSRSLANR